ncbi:hypothetical protein CWO84_01830 [Methylomonas sp. Kb3]|uniref:pilus assembly PilX family protein n=1 Tax=Methylomonas sp. Kb3 TaxID=1611544 RepID=UPI000C322BF7|nr:PilX N-terminal domain-containing pilus assembly protein [Methylomonas sp. Kb3]PKD42165.1 hypothetical protein CWO84_01830 [Methylomonas sp. Kb3]
MNKSKIKQTGAVLVVALIMLMLLTIIGVTGTNVTSLEEKMAGNMRDRNLAFQAAESALQAGETWLNTHAYTCSKAAGRFNPRDNDCNSATAETSEVWDSISWDDNDSVLLRAFCQTSALILVT